MLKRSFLTLTACILTSGPAWAQIDLGGGFGWGDAGDNVDSYASAGGTGVQKRDTGRTTTPNTVLLEVEGQPQAMPGTTYYTKKQTQNAGGIGGPMLPKTMTTQYGMAPGDIRTLRQLPPTRLDSFVRNAANAEDIYGREGTDGPNQENDAGFNENMTIGSGIRDRAPQLGHLSTGHYDPNLPSAWLDESATINPGGGGDFPGGNFGGQMPGGQMPGGQMPGGQMPGGDYPGGSMYSGS